MTARRRLPLGPTRAARIDAGGTAWRLRSLVAMGHDCARIADALGVGPVLIRRIVRGDTATITPAFRDIASQLWDAWWDKTPPQRTVSQRRAAAVALRMAEQRNWPAAAGLDEDLLDEPGYRPWSRYRPASGTGEAPDFHFRPIKPQACLTPAQRTRRRAS